MATSNTNPTFTSTGQNDLVAAVLAAIWTAPRPHTWMLHNIIMPILNPDPDPDPDSHPLPPLPSSSTAVPRSSMSGASISPLSHLRHGACTHVKMERLYGSYPCSWCHHPSPLGWVYSCVQNDEGYLLDSEIISQKSRTSKIEPIAEPQLNGQPASGSDEQAANAPCATIESAEFQPATPKSTKSQPHSSNGGQLNPALKIEETTAIAAAVQLQEGVNEHSNIKQQGGAGLLNASSNQSVHDANEQPELEEKFSIPHHQKPRLSPGIEKAIKEGHYSPEQVLKLRAQRQKVIDVINAAKKNIRLYAETTPNLSPPRRSTIRRSIEANPYLPFPVINEIHEIPKEPDRVVMVSSKQRMYPRCKHRACHNCRPTYVDRVWVKIDEVLSMQTSIPNIDFEADHRPVSDVAILRKIGLPKLATSRTRPPFSRMGMFSVSNNSQPISVPRQLPTDYLASENDVDHDAEPESRGFRESMRRAFRGMLSRRRDSFPARSSRMRRSKEMPAVEFDMELWRELNDELLQEASNTPLPGNDGMDGLGDDEKEVEVEAGAAVPEEGLDLGTADLILYI